jgi:hypothetical protein
MVFPDRQCRRPASDLAFAPNRPKNSHPSRVFHLGRFCRRWRTGWSFFPPLPKKNPIRIEGALQNLRRPKSRTGFDPMAIGRKAGVKSWSPHGPWCGVGTNCLVGPARKQPDFRIARMRSQKPLGMAGACPPGVWRRANRMGRWSRGPFSICC